MNLRPVKRRGATRDGGGQLVSDLGTAVRMQRGELLTVPLARDLRGNVVQYQARNRFECNLDRYLSRKWLTQEQHAVAIMFRRFWLEAVEGVRVQDKAGGGASDMLDHLNYVTYARRQLREGLRKLRPHHRQLVIDVCASDAPILRQYRMRMLVQALDELGKAWGMPGYI